MWIPAKIYNLLPWACLAMATAALLLPAGLVQAACIAYLYLYGLVVIVRRCWWRE